MNAVCAPFLYVMPELDAFAAFSKFVVFHAPLYFHKTIEGAYAGLQLFDEILKHCDVELYNYLLSKNIKSDFYAMPRTCFFLLTISHIKFLIKHPTFGGAVKTMGFYVRFRGSLKYYVCRSPTYPNP
jgi:hypothetical protein